MTKAKSYISTQVYQLPDDEAARTRFLNGVKALAEESKATWVAGSVHNEIDYADLLGTELANHVGEMAVEEIRLNFERNANS
ncbi:hypothetical protein ALQ64_02814 [Pseudomonas cannabina]|uniref:Uncharacterized protein n=1 Tax=Pseudomonas cannabina TaxID=86840 RepID=A0A3M3KDX1_PSECA|nr:hypothetical protein [Pseudomonas cannabina]RMN21136.1 hypothetical protein ALQ64_02814 [Pseudomonas cannabina]